MSKKFTYSIVTIVILIVLEPLFSIGIVGVAAVTGRDSRSVANDLHVPRLVLSPFFERHPIETALKARFVGRAYGNMQKMYVSDSILGWRYAKSVSTYSTLREDTYAISEFSPDQTTLYPWRFPNDQKFRSSGENEFHYKRPKPAGIFRIIVVGGSTVAGDFSESHRDSLPARLLTYLRKMVKERGLNGADQVEVINAGVGAYDSSQEYLYLLTEL